MKKNIKFLALALAGLLLGFSSCNNDDAVNGEDTGKPQNIRMKLTLNGSATKSETGAVASSTTAIFTDGILYFISSTGDIVRKYIIDPDAIETNLDAGTIRLGDLTGDGYTFSGLPGTITNAVVVGNVPSTVTPPASGNIDQLSVATLLTIASQKDDADAVDKVSLYGLGGGINGGDDPDAGSDNDYIVVNVAPVAARIELTDITGGTGIKSFKVAGIYLDDFYKTASLDITAVGELKGRSDAATDYWTSGAVATTAGYPSTDAGATYDDYTSSPIDAVAGKAAPSAGVWAYNFFAPDPYSAGNPRIIIRLTEVTYDNDELYNKDSSNSDHPAGQAYLTVKAFKDGSDPITFEPGKVYNIATDGLTFTPDHLATDPNTEPVDLDVAVSIASWVVVDTTPELL